MFYLGIRDTELKLHATLMSDKDTKMRKRKVVPNTRHGVYALIDWCGKQGLLAENLHAVLDLSSPCSQAPATTFHDCGVTVTMADPDRVRAYDRPGDTASKPGILNGPTLANYAMNSKPKTWQPVPAHVRALEAFIAQLEALQQDRLRSESRRTLAEAAGAPVLVTASIRDTLDFFDDEIAKIEKAIDDYIHHHPDLRFMRPRKLMDDAEYQIT